MLVSTIQKMLDKNIKLVEKTIEQKLEKKLETVTTLKEQIEKENDGDKVSYSKILAVPAEVRRVIQETKNDEKVEKLEHDKRSQNFIIHGAEEIGDTINEIECNDEEYVNDILKRLRVRAAPESVIRLGKPNDTKKRVLKISMESKKAKDDVMANLRRLKGSEEDFGKISVTDDYTASEREMIKDFSDRAKEQSKKDPTREFKIRGDPKNGLRIIAYKK